ncbi:hypothetical protein HPB50_011552 [Hyalomma asiaticum]|uniref:Uncharacterized protein n=1 Tax=Hyalomma asiaticum TaxID=266040 RepID=A0ACB7SK19_HYAAI|nr:hypothetical protein HPB50_011552 [Hyalomma asiaticum]
MGKVSEKPAESDHASNNPVPNPDALLQLKLAFEAEISFKDTMEAVEAKLCKMQKILDWGNLMGLEEFLRPKKADAEAFTTAQELGNRSPPDPCISKKNGNFKIACKENIVALPPASSPDKAAILLFTVYFILNLSYPYTFLQILGLVQRVFLKAKGQNMVRQVKPSFLLPFQRLDTTDSRKLPEMLQPVDLSSEHVHYQHRKGVMHGGHNCDRVDTPREATFSDGRAHPAD